MPRIILGGRRYIRRPTGINREQFTQAQTLAYTNTDIAKLVSTGPMVQGALAAAGQPLHGMKQNMQLFMEDATNLSKVMGSGHGSVNSSARMLTRTLQDPMHHMAAMSRYGFTLSQNEQMRIRTLEMTNGLYAAQQQMLTDIWDCLSRTVFRRRPPPFHSKISFSRHGSLRYRALVHSDRLNDHGRWCHPRRCR